jgi:hypothetical protein
MSKFYPDPFQQRLRQALQGLVVLIEGPVATMSSEAAASASSLTTQNHILFAVPDVIGDIGTGEQVEYIEAISITNEGTDNKLDGDIYIEVITETAATNPSVSLNAISELLIDAGTGDQVEFTEEVVITISNSIFTSVS